MISSSPFRKAPRQADAVVVSDAWWGLLLLNELVQRKIDAVLLRVPSGTRCLLPIFVGSGERFERFRLSFGDLLATKTWDASKKNWSEAQEYFAALKIKAERGRLVWFGKDENLEEPVLLGDFDKLEAKLKKKHQTRILEEKSWSGFQLEAGVYTVAGAVKAQICIFTADSMIKQALPSLGDKIIPVTLSAFEFPAKQTPAPDLSFFNDGLDFALRGHGVLHLGSFRNLYNDRGVGVLNKPDELTRESVTKFFRAKGWIEASDTRSFLSVSSVSCDGLPVVGELSEWPGTYVLSGFAAREHNFLFHFCKEIAEYISGAGGTEKLSWCSTKRFL